MNTKIKLTIRMILTNRAIKKSWGGGGNQNRKKMKEN